MKKVKWRWDYGVYVPFCPYCDELAYEKDKCVFCGKTYEWREGKYRGTEVNVGEYTVYQATDNHIYIYNAEGNMILHASCRKKMTEDELKDMVKVYEDLISTENNNNSCENCTFYDEDRNDQPCCTCHGQNFEEAKDEHTD